jgi:hypothetical protein
MKETHKAQILTFWNQFCFRAQVTAFPLWF